MPLLPDHNCPHESNIKQTYKELFGNGSKGIVKEFIALKTEFQSMNANVEKLATSYAALVKSQIEQDATQRAKADGHKRMSTAIQRVGTITAIVIGIVGIVYLVLDHI